MKQVAYLEDRNHLVFAKEIIEYSCVQQDAKLILPLLKLKSIKTDFPNKLLFYQFYKRIIQSLEQSSKGKLTLRIIPCEKNNQKFIYEFYDEIHFYPRVNLTLEKSSGYIILDCLPF